MSLQTQYFRQTHLDSAVAQGFHHLFSGCNADGSADGICRGGPLYSGLALVARQQLGDLDDDDRTHVVNWILSCQRRDGSYAAGPYNRYGSFDATVCAYAGIRACGVPDNSLAQRRALAYIERAGGFTRTSPLYFPALAISGLLRPEDFPPNYGILKLIPGAQAWMSTKMTHWAMLTASLLPAVLAGVSNRCKPARWQSNPLAYLEQQITLRQLLEVQNPGGSLCGVLLFTTSMLMAYSVLGLPVDSKPLAAGREWLRNCRIANATGLEYMPFDAHTWNTASMVRVGMLANLDPNDPTMRKSVDWLLERQTKIESPRTWQNPIPGAPRTGAWSFQANNELNPDCDTTARVLDALGRVRLRSDRADVERAIQDGLAWLLPMQNPDGGWPSMTRNLGSKPSGPILTHGYIPPSTLRQALAAALDPPLILQDPSTAALSARVMAGVVSSGDTNTRPAVDRCMEFLQAQQWHNRWWGRWEVNYLTGTAFCLSGAGAAGATAKDPWIRQAIDWIESCQNPDGGWGEGNETYYDWQAEGPFASRPGLTGKLVSALVSTGHGGSDTVARAVSYLMVSMDGDGRWEDVTDLDVIVPPDVLYNNPTSAQVDALLALVTYRTFTQG